MDGPKSLWHAVEQYLRWADVLDIGLVTVFVYFLLRWLSARTSRGILAGAVLVGCCYLLSDWLDLYLTRLLFQVGFVFLLLSVVIVLQQDIRRGFERLAALKWRRQRLPSNPDREVLQELLGTVAQMSLDKTGALLVFPGREPIDRFTHGGIRTDACVSPALLQSIFNPDSPGHDGAIIIVGGRVDQIGVHLPLSTNLEALGPGGTRHAAALGLAERCDALVVVVSEERGTISVAQHDKMHCVTVEELEQILNHSEASGPPTTVTSLTRHMLTRRWPLKFASLGIAVALWGIFAFRVDLVQREYVIPIEFRNLSSELVVDSPSSRYARVVLLSTERVLERIDTSTLVVTFDLSAATEGQSLRLQTSSGIQHLPDNLNVVDIEPEQIILDIKRAGEPLGADET